MVRNSVSERHSVILSEVCNYFLAVCWLAKPTKCEEEQLCCSGIWAGELYNRSCAAAWQLAGLGTPCALQTRLYCVLHSWGFQQPQCWGTRGWYWYSGAYNLFQSQAQEFIEKLQKVPSNLFIVLICTLTQYNSLVGRYLRSNYKSGQRSWFRMRSALGSVTLPNQEWTLT